MKKIIINRYFIFGFFVSLFLALFGFYHHSFDNKLAMEKQTTNSIRFMPIGDSYTIGNGVKVSERWPNLLVESVRREGITIELIYNPAISGYDAQDALVRELPLFEKERPDFATLFIGTNDSFRSRDVEVFKRDYVEILERMQNALTKKENLVVITIPNYLNFPGARGAAISVDEVKKYNMVIREEAGKRNLMVVDLFSDNQLKDESFFISDGIHPNPKGIKVWHDLIFPVVLQSLNN